MKIPEKLMATPVAFLDFAKGGYSQTRRNEQYGITQVVSAETRNSKPTVALMIDVLPDREFETLAELREAVKDLPEPEELAG